MTSELACCTWALTGPDAEVLQQIAATGFTWIDIQPGDFTKRTSLSRMQDLGLHFSCMALSFGIPPEVTLDSADPSQRAMALKAAQKALVRCEELAITTSYVIPGLDASEAGLARYAESLTQLADTAAKGGIGVCIEHFPGRALPTIAATLAFLRRVNHPNLYLLLDTGHAQMSGEDLPAAIASAGAKLGYVHLDDNDGENDLHLALYDGVLTKAALRAVFSALEGAGYSGRASLEFLPTLPDPLDALQRSRTIALAAMHEAP